MDDEFIQNIEIKNFKCFKDFKVDNLKRVNLIGGYNNMGKTTLMEACLLSTAQDINGLYYSLLAISSTRDIVNILTSNDSNDECTNKLIKQEAFNIKSNLGSIDYILQDDKYHIQTLEQSYEKTYSELHNLLQMNVPLIKYSFYTNFLSPNIFSNLLFKILIDNLNKSNKYDELNIYLQKIFNIQSIDIIDDKPHIKKNKQDGYKPLSSYGQGFKSLINILLALLDTKGHMFIDEIENGIHYTLYDKLWETVFKTSEERNMQIFITTHSKECIESYSKISKKRDEKDISFINLSTNKKDGLIAITLDGEMLRSEIEQNHEVRAW